VMVVVVAAWREFVGVVVVMVVVAAWREFVGGVVG